MEKKRRIANDQPGGVRRPSAFLLGNIPLENENYRRETQTKD